MIKHLTVFMVLSCSFYQVAAATSTVLILSADKRLKAAIAQDSMNRIAVANDRITQVFGDEECYVVQSEEHTGQLFLKPTAENGDKPLSITLITESGLTQDLMLTPTQQGATTLILKTVPTASRRPLERREENSSFKHDISWKGQEAISLQEQWVQAMKLMVMGQALAGEGEGGSRLKPPGFEVIWKQTYTFNAFKGYLYEVQNTTDTPIELQEKTFYQAGDLALSFAKRVLEAQEKTSLYVLSR
jgi:type-F conjugative transfer system secretin TraK